MSGDLVNGIFEAVGGGMILSNIRQLAKDRQVMGVRWEPLLFFTTWGFWNLFYYPSLGQWFSFVGGAFLVAANAFWLGQMIWFGRIKPWLDFINHWSK